VNGYGDSLDSAALGVTVGTPITVDNIGAATSGAWTTSTSSSGYYGTNYFHDGNTGSTGGKKVQFTPAIPTSGSYDIYARWPAGSARASNVPVDVVHHFGKSTLTLNQQVNGSTWVWLGRFRFDAGTGGSVTLRNDQTNSFVIADAIRFVPLTEEIIVDNSDYRDVSTTGTWTTSVVNSGFYGSDYFHDGFTNGGKGVEYRPNITEAGVYKVFLRWPTGSNRATAAPLDIVHAGGTATVPVNQTVNAATWNLIGSYQFNRDSTARITLRNDGAGGFVTADAVKLVGPTAP
jgi:hyaluronate lyase